METETIERWTLFRAIDQQIINEMGLTTDLINHTWTDKIPQPGDCVSDYVQLPENIELIVKESALSASWIVVCWCGLKDDSSH